VKVRFSDAALNDLRRIGDYIAQDSPLRARDFVRALRERATQVADHRSLSRWFLTMDARAFAAVCFVAI
jgi:plasmid stabilization system protein ParE